MVDIFLAGHPLAVHRDNCKYDFHSIYSNEYLPVHATSQESFGSCAFKYIKSVESQIRDFCHVIRDDLLYTEMCPLFL